MRKGKVNRIIRMREQRRRRLFFRILFMAKWECWELSDAIYPANFFCICLAFHGEPLIPNWFIRAFVIYSSLTMLARLPSVPAFEIKLEIRGEKMRRNEEGVFKLFFQFSNSRGGWKLSLFPQMREYDEMEMNSMDFFPALKIRGNQLLIFLHLTVPMPGGEKYAR